MVVKPHSVGFKNTSRYIVPETTTLAEHWGIITLAFTAPNATQCTTAKDSSLLSKHANQAKLYYPLHVFALEYVMYGLAMPNLHKNSLLIVCNS